MPTAQTTPAARKPLRLWPGVVIAALIVLIRFIVPLVVTGGAAYGMLGAMAGALLIVVWWVFFSRAPWPERLGAVVLMVIAALATKAVVHDSIAGGAMGFMLFVYALPVSLPLAFIAWAVATRRQPDGIRRMAMVAAIVLGCGVWVLARTGGVSGEGQFDLHWRWTPTPEERLLARETDLPLQPAPSPPTAAAPAASATATEPAPKRPDSTGAAGEPAASPADPVRGKTAVSTLPAVDPGFARVEWPGFRGPNRDGVVRGVRINTDWNASPPVEVWRRAIGPGWSSFAVAGDLLYTQEQRGGDELVSCYSLGTGEPVWVHRDGTRFYESNGGAGPRATPTLHDGRVYSMGATGVVNALDARTGALVWTRNAAADTKREIPDWGLASSPLVVGDLVVVAAAGHVAAYELDTGKPRWFGPTGGGGYSSPHLATIDGVTQILLMRGSRTISLAPADGALLWQHDWLPAVAIVQPALAGSGDVLIASGDTMGGLGMRRLSISRASTGWNVVEKWTSRGLKPYFNDSVIHKGHAYGFDGSIMASIDLSDGARRWKGGRYGHGQLLLLADQDVLLVLSEQGDVALVSATPDQFREIARFKVLEGKTWNHHVLVGDTLLVRNGEEMAAFRLATTLR